jgi:hypothetical protein
MSWPRVVTEAEKTGIMGVGFGENHPPEVAELFK